MSTVILLSSSPPPTFARSPTPVDASSSPLPSTAALIQGQSPGRKKFKAKTGLRDGFANTFTTARTVLAQKNGAENAIITPAGRTRFRSSQTESAKEAKEGDRGGVTTRTRSSKLVPALDMTEPILQKQSVKEQAVLGNTKSDAEYVQAGKTENAEDVTPQTVSPERAVARKLDWTPPTTKSQTGEDERPIQYSAAYLNGLLSNFAYADIAQPVQHTIETHNPAKRRRVSSINKPVAKTAAKPVSTLAQPSVKPPKTAVKRTRSPAKKALTITALATSNRIDNDEPDESPMMQYLTSTQARLSDLPTNTVLETKIQQTKVTAKKLKETRKSQSKSLLLSPKSAIKTYDDQDAIFGSASQLAREESPGLLRETIQAMKESESFMLSDPFSSPQRTQAISADNTPQAGTARFRKSRNLWSAAGRDEDNALLHVDTVDLTDTPAVRAAFTGKDVMLQFGSKTLTTTCTSSVSLRGGYSPRRLSSSKSVIDIGDIPSPQKSPRRAISSTTKSASPRRSPSRTEPKRKDTMPLPNVDVPATTAPPPPPKPNYAGLTVHELNKHIKSFGFKAMRKREKMIELLDRCWAEKHDINESAKEVEAEAEAEVEAESVPFGDFLSKVHDISSRPVPKIKKAKTSRKKSETEAQPKEKAARKPRQRKKKDAQEQAESIATTKPKPQRKRKSKTMASVDYSVHDVDDIWDTIPEELRVLEAFDDWAKPERKPKSKPKTKTQNQPAATASVPESRLPSPPPTLPTDNTTTCTSIEPLPTAPTDTHTKPISTTITPTPSPTTALSQITAAITHQSHTKHAGRNHNTNPTWHEKILLYDPIVLEDLAAWLNTDGLGAIGDDREVSALEVREWCETKGICCLWRGGWRGNKAAQSQG